EDLIQKPGAGRCSSRTMEDQPPRRLEGDFHGGPGREPHPTGRQGFVVDRFRTERQDISASEYEQGIAGCEGRAAIFHLKRDQISGLQAHLLDVAQGQLSGAQLGKNARTDPPFRVGDDDISGSSLVGSQLRNAARAQYGSKPDWGNRAVSPALSKG